MIKDLMDKLHTADNNAASNDNIAQPVSEPVPAQAVAPAGAVPTIPVPKAQVPTPSNLGGGSIPSPNNRIPKPKSFRNVFLGDSQMNDNEGIVIDLGDGISLNIPIKKRMTLQDFLHVAEKVKALEMIAQQERIN